MKSILGIFHFPLVGKAVILGKLVTLCENYYNLTNFNLILRNFIEDSI
jgi:hypothetical protein